MKTILRVNGTRDMFFQTVTSIETIKNEKIKDYSEEYKKGYFDLGHTGDMSKINFDHDMKSFFLDIEFGDWAVDTGYGEKLYHRDFDAVKKSISVINRIENKMDGCLFNDIRVMDQLFKLLKVQAVYIEVNGQKKLFDKSDMKKDRLNMFIAICEANKESFK